MITIDESGELVMTTKNAAQYFYATVLVSYAYIILLSDYVPQYSGSLVKDMFSLDFDSNDPILVFCNFILILIIPFSFILWKNCGGFTKSHFKNMFFSELILLTTFVLTYKYFAYAEPPVPVVLIWLVCVIFYLYRYIRGFVRINKNLEFWTGLLMGKLLAFIAKFIAHPGWELKIIDFFQYIRITYKLYLEFGIYIVFLLFICILLCFIYFSKDD